MPEDDVSGYRGAEAVYRDEDCVHVSVVLLAECTLVGRLAGKWQVSDQGCLLEHVPIRPPYFLFDFQLEPIQSDWVWKKLAGLDHQFNYEEISAFVRLRPNRALKHFKSALRGDNETF